MNFRTAIMIIVVVCVVLTALLGASIEAAAWSWLDWLLPPSAQPEEAEYDPHDERAQRTLDVVFAFFLTGDGDESTAYEQLLDMLLAQPGRKFCVGMSPDLASALSWSDSRAVRLMRDGVSRGQFELLGSALSDGVLAALDPWDARLAVNLGSARASDMFGKTPAGFWNPSGLWRQEIVLPVSAGGYSHTIADSKIMAASGLDALPAHAPVRISWGGREIVVFQSDPAFARAVEKSVASGATGSAIDYLERAYAEDTADAAVVVYAREARASDAASTWDGLSRLLEAIDKEPWLRLTTLEERLQSGPRPRAAAQLADGEPEELRRAATSAGYSDWQDYNSNCRELQDARNLFGDVRRRIQAVEEDLHRTAASQSLAPAASRLLDYAKLIFSGHQRRFGHPGAESAESAQWEAVRGAYVAALAAWQCAHPATSAYQEDVDRDGIEEVILVNPTDMFVLSPAGGKMIYWYDLEHGEEIVGGDLASKSASGHEARGGALADSIAGTASSADGLTDIVYNVQLGADSASAVMDVVIGDAKLKKEYAMGQRRFQVRYTLQATGQVDLSVASVFRPDPYWIATGGGDSLVYLHSDGSPANALAPDIGFGLANIVSGSAVMASVDPDGEDSAPAAEVWSDSVPFGRSLCFGYRLKMWPGASASMSIRFERSRIGAAAPPILSVEPKGESIAAVLPSYTRRIAVRELSDGFPVETLMLTAAQDRKAKVLEAVAPMPSGQFDLVTTSVTGRTTTIERADRYVGANARFEFFPRIADSGVELAPGYHRVGSAMGVLWAAVGAAAIIGAVAVVVHLARSRRRPSGP